MTSKKLRIMITATIFSSLLGCASTSQVAESSDEQATETKNTLVSANEKWRCSSVKKTGTRIKGRECTNAALRKQRKQDAKDAMEERARLEELTRMKQLENGQ